MQHLYALTQDMQNLTLLVEMMQRLEDVKKLLEIARNAQKIANKLYFEKISS